LSIFLVPHIQFPGSWSGYLLKPSEVIVILLIILQLFIRINPYIKFSFLNLSILFLFISILISFVTGLGVTGFNNREIFFDKDGDLYYWLLGLKKIISFAICIYGFLLLKSLSYKEYFGQLTLAWIIGLIFSVLIKLFMFLSGMDDLLIRGGVLKEGNFAVSYYFLSILICFSSWSFHKFIAPLGVLFALIGLVIAKSAITPFIGGSLLLFLILTRRNIYDFFVIGFAVLLFILFNLFFNDGANFLVGKFEISDEISNINFSFHDRLSLASSAVSMWLDYPLVGGGLGSFGFLYTDYIDDFSALYYDFKTLRIVNNIYLQILAEQGILGFLAWFLFFYALLRELSINIGIKNFATASIIVVLSSWLAFPTYSSLFQWMGIGLIFNRYGVSHAKLLRPA
jgi:O-antigen ligase